LPVRILLRWQDYDLILTHGLWEKMICRFLLWARAHNVTDMIHEIETKKREISLNNYNEP